MKYRVQIERDEAPANVKEAIEARLASLSTHDEPAPPPIAEDVTEVRA